MQKILLLFLTLWFLNAEESSALPLNATQAFVEKDLYLSYDVIPEKLYLNQVFSLSVKIVNTNKDHEQIVREIAAFDGLKLIENTPQSTRSGYTTLDTYLFQATKPLVKTPDLYYSLNRINDENSTLSPALLQGKYIKALELNPPQHFCNVLAKSFQVTSSRTTHYDDSHNIVVFSVQAEQANIADFNLSSETNQGFESYHTDYLSNRMSYFIVVPKSENSLFFSYFDLNVHAYKTVSIGLQLDDDSVSTQMNISPTEYTHTLTKIFGASGIVIIGLLLFLFTHKKRYFFIIALTPIVYIIWVYFPKQTLCIKADRNIYLLPMSHATIFEKTINEEHYTKLGKVDEYNKVLLHNNTIGWIKDENLCED